MTPDRYIIKHSRGYLNVDGEHIHFTEDGNWANIRMHNHPTTMQRSPLSETSTRIYGYSRIGFALGLIATGLLVYAAISRSLLLFFLAVSVAYLAWAASRPESLSGFTIDKSNIVTARLVDKELTLTVQEKGIDTTTVVLTDIDSTAAQRLCTTLETELST